MKFPLLLASLVCISASYGAGVVSTKSNTSVSDYVLLSAIADVESGNNSAKCGQLGERTRLQIMPETWREFSRLPHSAAASNRAETDRVARAYLAVIRERLRARGVPTSPFYIAAAWNAGPSCRRLPSSTVAYATRVANIVAQLEAARAEREAEAIAAATPPKPLPVFFSPEPTESKLVAFPDPQLSVSPVRVELAVDRTPVATPSGEFFPRAKLTLPELNSRGAFAATYGGGIPVIAVQ